jgi:serine/threonine protein kinase
LDLDGRSDIFSFGVVLLEMLTGENPFFDSDPIVTMYNIIHKEVTLGLDVPPALREIVQKALQKDRRCRYQDFMEIKKDLWTIQASST